MKEVRQLERELILPGGNKKPFSEGLTSSETPPTSEATTGRPVHIASIILTGRPSEREDRTNTSKDERSILASSLKPKKFIRDESPYSSTIAIHCRRPGPSPMNVKIHGNSHKETRDLTIVAASLGCSNLIIETNCSGDSGDSLVAEREPE
jgi:hypothetical protein